MNINDLRESILSSIDSFVLILKNNNIIFNFKDFFECDVSGVSLNKKDICKVYYADINITTLKKVYKYEIKEIDPDMENKDIIDYILNQIFISYKDKFKTTKVYVGMANKKICIAVPTEKINDIKYKKIKLTSW